MISSRWVAEALRFRRSEKPLRYELQTGVIRVKPLHLGQGPIRPAPAKWCQKHTTALEFRGARGQPPMSVLPAGVDHRPSASFSPPAFGRQTPAS